MSTDFAEWLNFYALEPFGAQADEIHLAAIRALITNYLRPKHQPAYPVSDFLITAKAPKRQQTVEEMYALFSQRKS